MYVIGYYSAIKKKEGNLAICGNVDGTWGHYDKWNKPDRERQILHGITYMWNPKKSRTHRNKV